jgi:hypothetical protein
MTLLVLAPSRAAMAQCDALRTHRPVQDLFGSDVVYLQESGEVQVELKPTLTNRDRVRTANLETVAEFGARDWWQVETEWDAHDWTRSPHKRATSDTGDIAIGTRFGWRCVGGSPYHLSLGVSVSVPGSNRTPADRVRQVTLTPVLIAGRDIGLTAHVFSSIELEAPIDRRNRSGWTYTSDTGMFVRLVHGFRMTLELSIERGPDTDVHVLPGLLWHKRDMLEAGVAMLAPLSRHSGRGVLAHIVYEFGGKEGSESGEDRLLQRSRRAAAQRHTG